MYRLKRRESRDSRKNEIYREIGIHKLPRRSRFVDSLLKEHCDVRVHQARLVAGDTNHSFRLLKDVEPNVPQTTVSYVVATPKPRLVHLEIIPQGRVPFSIGNYTHKAFRYMVKVKIGGAAGLMARLVGKQPANLQAWVLAESAPAFVRFDGPLYSGGPTWRLEVALPAAWPESQQ